MGKKLLFFLACVFMTASMAFAQQSVTGTVVDNESGEPLIGVTVRVPGTDTGVLTDADGKFSLTLPAGKKNLSFNFMGMRPAELPARNGMVVRMETDTKVMDEVMVVAFGTATKASFTGSAKVVGSETLEKSQASNVVNALAGAVPGLQLTSSNGAPGSQSTVRVRGFNSLNAGNKPLFVVDGAPCNEDFDIGNINPSDIESINVLKDAASNALYGARGSNGVIMITTKKAKQGDAIISFDSKWGWNSRALQYYNTIKDPAQYYEMQYGALYNYYVNHDDPTKRISPTQAWIKANENLCGDQSSGGLGYNIWTLPANQKLVGMNGKLNPNARLGRLVKYNGEDFWIVPDDWDEAATRVGHRQEYNVSATAASEKSNFFASVGYLSNEGITEKSDYKRFTSRLKADYQVKPWAKVGMNAAYTRFDSNSLDNNGNETSTGNIWAMTQGLAPIYPFYIRNGDGSFKFDSNGIQMLDYGDGVNGGMSRPYISDANPVQDIRLNTRNTEGNAFMGNVFANINLFKGLTLTVNGTADLDETRYTYVYNKYYGQFDSTGGTVTKAHSRYFSYNYQQLLNYVFNIGKNNFNLLAGHECTYDKYYELSGSKSKMFSDENKELDGAVVDGQSAGSYITRYNNEGYFLRGMYDYNERIFASASYRRDASSRFVPENRWGNFWSVGGAWIISREKWFPKSSWLNMLKMKASVGSQGNDRIGNYRYTDTYTISNSDGNVSTAFAAKGNREITWETNTNVNVGLEFEVFKRLSGSVEYFNRKTSDMLMRFRVPSSMGYSSFWDNVGDMSNRGVEIDLNANIFNLKHFQWDINANVSFLKNEITKLHEDVKTASIYNADGKEYKGYVDVDYIIAEGASIYTWRLKEYAGVEKETGKSLWYKNKLDENGNVIGRETTSVYSDADYYVTDKSTVPPVFGGFGTSLRFYGFDLSARFSYQLGGYGFDSSYQTFMASPIASNTGYNFHADQLNAWTPTNTDTDIPRMQFGDTYANGNSDRWLTKASYLNIENINFGYTLPKSLLSKANISSLRLYLQAENVFYWSKRKGFDPRQTYSDRANATNYSPMRTISAGVKLTF